MADDTNSNTPTRNSGIFLSKEFKQFANNVLSNDSIKSYLSYLNRVLPILKGLCQDVKIDIMDEVKKEMTKGRGLPKYKLIEALLDSAVSKLEQYHQYLKQNGAPQKDIKNLSDWRSAFRLYRESILDNLKGSKSCGQPLTDKQKNLIQRLNGDKFIIDRDDLISNFANRLAGQDRTSGSNKIWLPLGLIGKILIHPNTLHQLCLGWATTVLIHYSGGKIQVKNIDSLEIDYTSGQGDVYVNFTDKSGFPHRERVFDPALSGSPAMPMTLDLLSDGHIDHIVDINAVLKNMYTQHQNNGTYPNLYALTQLVKNTAAKLGISASLSTNQDPIYKAALKDPAINSINYAQLWNELNLAALNAYNGNPNLQFVSQTWNLSTKKQNQSANKQSSATTTVSTTVASSPREVNNVTSSKRNYAQYVLITNPTTGTEVTVGGKNRIAKVFVEEYCKLHPSTTLSDMQTILADIKTPNILSDQDAGRTFQIDGKDWFVLNGIWGEGSSYFEKLKKVIKDNGMDLKP
jgi:hypothetical protein